MPRKASMRKNIISILRSAPDTFFSTYHFLGEMYHNGEWIFFSYKAPTRLTEIHQDGLTDRRLVKGKSGARYYEYRIKPKHV